ncbi:MAG: FixH family protein [Bacteroidota bacterium]
MRFPFRLHERPDLLWPLGILLLILGGMATSLSVVVASKSDGGVAVEEEYYAQALAWNETASAQAASDRLAWTATVELAPHPVTPGLTRVQIGIHEAQRNAVEGLVGEVAVQRPDEATPRGTFPLQATNRPGHYVADVPLSQAGLWDLHLVAERGSDRFLHRERTEVR